MKSQSSKGKGWLESLVQRCFPDFYRMLKLMHLEHVLKLSGGVRSMLLLSSVISIAFAYVWMTDLWHGTCFKRTPWTEKGLARFTCTYQSVGSIIFLALFYLSLVALINYDDEYGELAKKKELLLEELKHQTINALQKAKATASKLADILANEMVYTLTTHTVHMRDILQSVEETQPEMKSSLLDAMARHLHRIREPAIKHFERLIDFSGSDELDNLLNEEHQESMVRLLLGIYDDDPPGISVPRTETVTDSTYHHISPTASTSCFPRGDQTGSSSDLMTEHFQVSDEFVRDAKNKFHAKAEVKKNEPGRVVLRPVLIVLAWFSEISKSDAQPPEKEDDAQTRPRGQTDDVESQIDDIQSPTPRCCRLSMTQIIENIRYSKQGQYMLVGTIFCTLYFLFYIVTLRNVFKLLGEGECASEEIACVGAAIRKSMGACAMFCYIVSMAFVLQKVDKIDHVLMAQKELHKMEDFKHEVDKLNAHAFGGQRVSLMEELHNQLETKRKIVFDFARNKNPSLEDYQKLLEDMKRRSEPIRSKSQAAGERGSSIERRPLLQGSSAQQSSVQIRR